MMTRYIGRTASVVTCLLALVSALLALHGAMAVGSAQILTTPAAVRLDVWPGSPGGTAEALVRFDPADGVRGFNLLLQFAPGGLLSASAADFQRSAIFFPETSLGSHALNSTRDAGSGRVRIIGLAPVTTKKGLEYG